MHVKIENFQPKHYRRLAPMVIRYFNEVNKEDLEEHTPVFLNGAWTSIAKIDAKLQALLYEGIFCKVAIHDDEIIGFIWFKDLFRCMVVGIEAFYIAPAYRRSKAGQALVNSFSNEFNRGEFTIFATYHENNPPEQMLAAFKGWEKVRHTNDRDLVMIKGYWNIAEQGKEEYEGTILARKFGEAR